MAAAEASLAARLRSHAKLFRLGQPQSWQSDQLAKLLDDAADRIEQLEAPPVRLTPSSWHLSECAIPMGLSDACTCRDSWPD